MKVQRKTVLVTHRVHTRGQKIGFVSFSEIARANLKIQAGNADISRVLPLMSLVDAPASSSRGYTANIVREHAYRNRIQASLVHTSMCHICLRQSINTMDDIPAQDMKTV